MINLRLKTLLGAGCFSLGLIGSVHAGGLERGGYDIDLLFDPAPVLSKTRQPLLVVQADLDREVPTFHGEQLAQLGRSRLKAQPTDFVHLPGLNHLLARAQTGSVGEYGSLAERSISPAAVLEISAWLKKTLAPPQERAK